MSLLSVALTLQHFISEEKLIALHALIRLHASPYFPEELFPGHALLPHKLGQLGRLETFFLLVLCHLLSVGIKENLSLCALDLVRDLTSEQLAALCAKTQL